MARISGRAVARSAIEVPARLLHARRDRDSAGGPSTPARLHFVEHPIGDSDLRIPIGLRAGFGELGRHGSIIHPKLGPLFRMGSVATSLELEIDHPIDAGIAKFCDTCRACRKYCPPQAIPDERSPEAGPDHLDRYVVDTGRCFPYFAKYSYCSICLPVCVYNHKEWARDFETGEPTKLFPKVIMLASPPPAGSRRRQRVPSVSEAQSFMRLLIAVAPVALVLCAAPGIVAPVSAQPGTASLSGRILDPQGATWRQPR